MVILKWKKVLLILRLINSVFAVNSAFIINKMDTIEKYFNYRGGFDIFEGNIYHNDTFSYGFSNFRKSVFPIIVLALISKSGWSLIYVREKFNKKTVMCGRNFTND